MFYIPQHTYSTEKIRRLALLLHLEPLFLPLPPSRASASCCELAPLLCSPAACDCVSHLPRHSVVARTLFEARTYTRRRDCRRLEPRSRGVSASASTDGTRQSNAISPWRQVRYACKAAWADNGTRCPRFRPETTAQRPAPRHAFVALAASF